MDEHVNSYFSFDRVIFRWWTNTKTIEHTLIKPRSPHPFVELIFKYLNSKKKISTRSGGFRLLTKHSKRKKFQYIYRLYLFTEKFSQFKKGTLKEFFNQLISDSPHTVVYEYKIFFNYLLKHNIHFDTPKNAALIQCEKEIPNIPKPKNIPRDSLGQSLLANDVMTETALFDGIQYLWGDAWENIQKLREFASQFHNNESLKMTGKSFRGTYLNKEIWYEILTQENLDELIKESNLAMWNSKEFKKKAPELGNFLIHEEQRISTSLGQPPVVFLSPKFVLGPSDEEIFIVWSLLAKHSFSLQGLQDLKVNDISFNDNSKTVQIVPNKNRGQNSNTTRINLAIFKQGTNAYTIMKDYKSLMVSFYQSKGLSENEIGNARAINRGNFKTTTLGFLTKCYSKSNAWQNSPRWKHIKPFITRWEKIELINSLVTNYLRKGSKTRQQAGEKLKKLGFKRPDDAKRIYLSSTKFSQSGKIDQYNYEIYSQNSDLELNNGTHTVVHSDIQEKVDAALRNHSLETDINVYFSRNQSKIMLDAHHKVGAQVGNQMVKEAKALTKVLSNNITLKGIREFTGTSTESERLSSPEGLAEFFNKSGFTINEFFGIQEGNRLIIIKHPLILAIIKHYISFLDESLNNLHHDQTRNISEPAKLPRKIAEIESVRAVLYILSEKHFDETLHVQAEMILDKYELPTYLPIF